MFYWSCTALRNLKVRDYKQIVTIVIVILTFIIRIIFIIVIIRIIIITIIIDDIIIITFIYRFQLSFLFGLTNSKARKCDGSPVTG
jgi:hypothetical protein